MNKAVRLQRTFARLVPEGTVPETLSTDTMRGLGALHERATKEEEPEIAEAASSILQNPNDATRWKLLDVLSPTS